MIEITPFEIGLIAAIVVPLYPLIARLEYRVGKLKEEVEILKSILLKFVRLNGGRK